jgi:hypothetical protein
VRDRRPGDRHDGQQGAETGEVIWIGGVKRQSLGDRSRCDHQVDDSSPRLAAGSDDGRCHAAEDTGGLDVEGHGIEFVLDPLQDLKTPGTLGVFVIPVLLVVAPDLVQPGDSSARVMALIAGA